MFFFFEKVFDDLITPQELFKKTVILDMSNKDIPFLDMS